MRRPISLLLLLFPLFQCFLVGCSDEQGGASDREGAERGATAGEPSAPRESAAAPHQGSGPGATEEEEEEQRQQDEASWGADYPLHGLVTGLQLPVRRAPDPEANPVGWLRIGNRVRLKPQATRTSTCSSGWHEVHPQGFVCAGQGVEIGEAPPTGELVARPPARDNALPYQYWFVKDGMVPEFHRPPSRESQAAAAALSERVLDLRRREQDERASRVARGDVQGEPERPAAVNRFLERGFFVAGLGTELREERAFVRTVRGRYVRQSQLLERTGSEFVGVELGEARSLPVAWVVRETELRIRRERWDGEVAFVRDTESPPLERHAIVEGWLRRENMDDKVMHVLEGDRYVREWFLAVAEARERPRGVGEDEPWVHVDLGQQTLVLYEGDTPVFATLVSSGQEGFETATGLFQIRRKYVADTMANIGDGNDEQYSIEDVPWTQYFEGSLALHGAFWHDRFGLPRSHGCVNLSPADARRVFDALWPRVPNGWLGVSTEDRTFEASHVWVTE